MYFRNPVPLIKASLGGHLDSQKLTELCCEMSSASSRLQARMQLDGSRTRLPGFIASELQ